MKSRHNPVDNALGVIHAFVYSEGISPRMKLGVSAYSWVCNLLAIKIN